LANSLEGFTLPLMDPINEYDETGEEPPATPAATVVIFRRDPAGKAAQLLMVERSASMNFAGGAAVFPGGRVDDADFDFATRLGAIDEDARDEIAARIAAVRETIEETGLVIGVHERATADEARAARDLLRGEIGLEAMLARMNWTPDLDALVPFARWRPKHRHLRVFDTRFYLADLGTGAVEVLVDQTENTHLFWASASEALDYAESGRIKIIYPTRRNLERLAQFDDFSAARAHADSVPVRMITPFVTKREGEPWLSIPDDAGYPVTGEKLDSAARA